MPDKIRKRLNIYFRQTAKAFRAARQTQIFYHIKKNIPFTISKITNRQFLRQIQKLKKIDTTLKLRKRI